MNTLTPLGKALAAFFATMVVGLLVLSIWANDRGSATEVALLEGIASSTIGTPAECDAMYHAIWRVKQEPTHSTLINIAESLDCPFSE